MAKRAKHAAAEAVEMSPASPAAPQLPEIVPPQSPESPQLGTQQPEADQPPRPLLSGPVPVQDRQSGRLQGPLPAQQASRRVSDTVRDGSRNDMPSEAIREFVKSYKVQSSDGSGEKSLFDSR